MSAEKQSWVDEKDLRYVFPQTTEEVQALLPAAQEIMENLPHQVSPAFFDWILQNPYAMIMIYLHDTPVMFAMREMPPGLDAVEVHGVVKKGMEKLGIQYYVQLRMMEDTFINHDKKQVIIRFDKSNRSARGFAWRWGFRPSGEKNGYLYYTLTKDRYLEKRDSLWAMFKMDRTVTPTGAPSI